MKTCVVRFKQQAHANHTEQHCYFLQHMNYTLRTGWDTLGTRNTEKRSTVCTFIWQLALGFIITVTEVIFVRF